MTNLVLRYTGEIESFYQLISKFVVQIWKLVGLEATIWILGLTYLALFNSPETTHFTICPFANLGIKFCPGCGLGNSISYLIRGDISSSLQSHPLGIFALIIITLRIISIIKNNRRRYA